jgi:hypothetical protein
MRFLPGVLILLLACCDKPTPLAPLPREEAVKQARMAAQDAFNRLSAELAKAIADGGPVAAIPVCSVKARPLVAEVSAARQIGMVRLSDRARNPEQAAAGTDLAAIESFREAIKRGETPQPEIVEMEDSSTVVRLPIIVSQPLCLQCHGGQSDIAPETREAILEVYPDDKATGYQLNDLRGIWRITVPPQARP